MEYVRLGSTGLKISRLALGCMSYGDPTTPNAHEWSLREEDAQPYFRQAVELGITFWDTANSYQAGTSEEVVGRAVSRYSRRENIVLATKVYGKMHDGPGGQGLSRTAILEQIDASLSRLGTDYVDLYQIHRFDPNTPSRQDEPELMAMCADMGVGLVPYSPQGKGRLARPWGEQSVRSTVDKVVQSFDSPHDEPVVNEVQRIAEARDVTMAQVALAWVLTNPIVSAPIVGATKPHHLTEAVNALELTLTEEEITALEKPYTNSGPSWF
jgi:1-deoxyxylulose-5-phosphate synthase